MYGVELFDVGDKLSDIGMSLYDFLMPEIQVD